MGFVTSKAMLYPATVNDQAYLLAEAIREWPFQVKHAGVTLDDGRAYVPVARNNKVLDHVDDPFALLAFAKRVINLPDFEDGSPGWQRIVDQVGVQLTWEGICVNPDEPWAQLFTGAERHRVNAAAE